MHSKNTESLESYLTTRLWLLSIPLMLGFAVIANLYSMLTSTIILIELFLFCLYFLIIFQIKKVVLIAYNRSILHIEAILQEDYQQYAKAAFAKGKVPELHSKLNLLGDSIQLQKSRYDQHAFIVYQLITQLESPILVFNDKQKLTFGNDEFYHLFGQPWQMFRFGSAHLLGLQKSKEIWQFKEHSKNTKWQIRHSRFIDDGQTHELLIFIDVEPVLRSSQLDAWQQIIRVLGHEIRNSLAPVSSLAETLAEKSVNKNDKVALSVITERCQHLQDFVTRYSSLSNPLILKQKWLNVSKLMDIVSGLFKDLEIKIISKINKIWADETLLTQVLINLIKNSKEANATHIVVNIDENSRYHLVKLSDNGHGLTNMENIFVPLYSTKTHGQGIGLVFCRNIIEQHKGKIELINNPISGVSVKFQILKNNEI